MSDDLPLFPSARPAEACSYGLTTKWASVRQRVNLFQIHCDYGLSRAEPVRAHRVGSLTLDLHGGAEFLIPHLRQVV